MNLDNINFIPTKCQAREGYQSKKLLTLSAVARAYFHGPSVNFNLAHSFKSGAEECEWARLLWGVERHFCKKSAVKLRMRGEPTGRT